jgi:hypothetical protein
VFWSRQVHGKTDLADQADKYCDQPTWSGVKTGYNCQTYLKASAITTTEEEAESDY